MIQTTEQFIQLLDSKSFSIESLFIERTGMDWDYDAKTFEELGFDTIDFIEMIMDIEKILGCHISDDCAELIEEMNPNDLTKRARRQKKLDDLGI